ncbi:hypothetical protein TNCT_430571 [Trichonephila clavata]|uniref:Uncharacterized protein n=1 Tax=Trichonephila clavata TaxID=2740835 RepID=A0A8X6JCA7_TRICU|nr:hypothetical protein TNCT_430571 [Trichonephila clavata]
MWTTFTAESRGPINGMTAGIRHFYSNTVNLPIFSGDRHGGKVRNLGTTCPNGGTTFTGHGDLTPDEYVGFFKTSKETETYAAHRLGVKIRANS